MQKSSAKSLANTLTLITSWNCGYRHTSLKISRLSLLLLPDTSFTCRFNLIKRIRKIKSKRQKETSYEPHIINRTPYHLVRHCRQLQFRFNNQIKLRYRKWRKWVAPVQDEGKRGNWRVVEWWRGRERIIVDLQSWKAMRSVRNWRWNRNEVEDDCM